jgi:2-polyprenyl-6-methoxyphenol hydroxylase-like FAD-dependent oxidoreductase
LDSPLRVAVIGYGIAGIAAAICLRRLGHAVSHFERGGRARPQGGGLLLSPGAVRTLRVLGAGEQVAALGAAVYGADHMDAAGRPYLSLDLTSHPGIADAGAGTASVPDPPLGVLRGALLDALTEVDGGAAKLQPLGAVHSVDARNGTINDDEGRRIGPFDLVVGADGADSSLREHLRPGIRRDHLYASAALVCELPAPTERSSDRLELIFRGTSHIAVWPVGRRHPGSPEMLNIAVNVPRRELAARRDPADWRRHVVGLCPWLEPSLSAIRESRQLLEYTYRHTELRSLRRGRIVLLGDAAHPMSPQLGQGVDLALADSWALGEALRDDGPLEKALERFDHRRRTALSSRQRLSRWVTPAFQGESRALAICRDGALRIAARSALLRRAMIRSIWS